MMSKGSHYLDVNAKRPKQVLPGISVRAFWLEKLLSAFVDLAPHADMPQHQHPEEQFGYVVGGEMMFTLNGEKKKLVAGDSYLIPPNVPHSVVAGPKGAKVIDVFSPPPARLQ